MVLLLNENRCIVHLKEALSYHLKTAQANLNLSLAGKSNPIEPRFNDVMLKAAGKGEEGIIKGRTGV